jgi:hypothetical protein
MVVIEIPDSLILVVQRHEQNVAVRADVQDASQGRWGLHSRKSPNHLYENLPVMIFRDCQLSWLGRSINDLPEVRKLPTVTLATSKP